MKWIVPLLASILPFQAHADIYKCVNEKGKSTFRQRRCGDTAQVITVKPLNRSDPSPASREDYADQLDAINTRTEIKKLEREISRLRTKKRSLTRKMDAELTVLRRKKQMLQTTWQAQHGKRAFLRRCNQYLIATKRKLKLHKIESMMRPENWRTYALAVN